MLIKRLFWTESAKTNLNCNYVEPCWAETNFGDFSKGRDNFHCPSDEINFR